MAAIRKGDTTSIAKYFLKFSIGAALVRYLIFLNILGSRIFLKNTTTMKKIFTTIVAFTSVIFIFISCSKDSGGTSGGGGNTTLNCSSVAKLFAVDVNPTIQAFCNTPACHANGSINGPGPLTNYSQIFNARVSIRAAISSGIMPQGTTLSASQKNAILCWIDSGSPNN